MQKFDIFIRGINPERLDEADAIRANAAKTLQIRLTDLDDLLAQPSVCIHRNATEEEAKNYQRTLTKLGLVSLYSPVVQSASLELIPMEDEFAETTLNCPNCEHEMTISEEEVEPEKCEKCGINITKFLEQKKQNEEREALKAKLLASQAIINNERLKQQQEEAERQRKLDLEKQVLEELKGSQVKKPLNLKLFAIGGGMALATAGASYFLTQRNVAPPALSNPASPSLVTGAEIQPSSDVSVKLAAPKKSASPMNAQQAMQKTHDQAAKFLSGFGLDADAFANAGGTTGESSVPPTNDEIMATVAAMTAGYETTNTTSATSSPAINNPIPSENPPVSTTFSPAAVNNSIPSGNPSVSSISAPQNAVTKNPAPPPLQANNANELFTVINGDIAWDSFLAKNSKILLDRQLPENAAKLSKFIIANDVYIDAIGALLHSAQQAKQTKLLDDNFAAIETRLTPLSTEQQAVYFAQASRYLTLENGKNHLLAKSENLLANLQVPESQLNVILKLAVTYSKAGNIEIANSYFSKINTLLTSITDLDSQAQLRAAVALAYYDINNIPVAVQWINSTEPLLKQLKPETLSTLISVYAQCNQWQSVLALLAQIDAKAQYDLRLYRTITASLKAGFVTNALELHKSLHAPVYKALANVLIANYSPATAAELVANAEQMSANLIPAEKITVTSQLVDYYGRLKNAAKIETFITATQDALTKLPTSEEKDALLEAVIKHYIHGFQMKAASNLLTAIQSTAIKTRLNLEINALTDVSGLLK
jgi:hypothetical protein